MKPGAMGIITFAAVLATIPGLGCQDQNAPRSQLVITRIAETDVELETYDYTFLSDVITAGAYVEDQIYITVRNEPRSTMLNISPTGPYGYVTLTRYDVRYELAGESINSFSGGMNLSIPSGSETIALITIVTAVSKTEPPLSTLATEATELLATAYITLHGYELTSEEEIETEFAIQINFADWNDPD